MAALTEREREICGCSPAGLSNAELAQCSSLGETTVKTHVSSVLRKLGVRDRVQAVIVAYDAGLVRPGRAPPPGASRVLDVSNRILAAGR